MNKEATLKKAHKSGFEDELEKISIYGKAYKEANIAHWKRLDELGKEYRKAVKPYKKQEGAHLISTLGGATAGGTIGAVGKKFAGNRALAIMLGILAGGAGTSALAKKIIGIKNPKWREAHEIADIKFKRGWEGSERQGRRDIKMSRLGSKSEKIKAKIKKLQKASIS